MIHSTQLQINGLDVYEHGVVIGRRGASLEVKGPNGKSAWYRETELQPVLFDKQSLGACVQNGVLGVRVEQQFIPVSASDSAACNQRSTCSRKHAIDCITCVLNCR